MHIDKPTSDDALEDNIEALICEIAVEMLERVCKNWTKLMDHLKAQHLHEIIFKHLIIWTVLSIQIKISYIFLSFMKVIKASRGYCGIFEMKKYKKKCT